MTRSLTDVPPPGVHDPSRTRAVLAVCAAMAAAGLLYLNALDNPFVYDDHRQILENRSLWHVTDVRWLLLENATRPVLNLSYLLDRVVWGPSPFGFHLTNVLLHVLNVGLLYVLGVWLTRLWLARGGPADGIVPRPHVVAFGAAALLAVHPMMTQAVGYVSGRSEVLCATFFLLALLTALRWIRSGGAGWLLLMAVLWVLAMATKEIAALFPVVLLACDRLVCPGTKAERRRRLARLHEPLLGVAALAIVVRLAVLGVIEHGWLRPDWRLFLVELDVVRRYLTMMLAPAGQTIFHAVAPVEGLLDPRALLGLGVVSFVVLLAWALRPVQGVASLGLLWFFLVLVPSIGLVVLDRAEPMAEHRTYLAGMGLFLAAGTAADWLTERAARRSWPIKWAYRTALAWALVLLAAQTLLRNAIWHDPVTLWQEASGRAPHHWLPYVPLGEALHAAGRHDEAVAALATAVRLNPAETATPGKLGVCLVEVGRLDEAQALFEEMGRNDPGSPESHYGLGLVALAHGQTAAARQHLLDVLVYDALNIPARRVLATVAEAAGEAAVALRYCREIGEIAPGTPGNDDCIRRNRDRLGEAPVGRP